MPELDDLFEQLRETVEDMSFPTVRRWLEKNPGGKVVGHFQVYFPEEIVEAGGMLPLKVMGGGNLIEAKQADSRFASFICSICRTSLELGLSGRLGFLSAFVTHPICDAARNMAGIWGRNFPEQLTQILYLPQNANSRYAPQYLRDEYHRMKGDFEKLCGHPITDDDLRKTIVVFNENRRLLREIYRVRRDTPWQLSLSESYILTRVGTMMPKAEHNEILHQVLALLPSRNRKKQDRPRVVFEGGFCEQPSLDMLYTLDESVYVVDDDLLIGARWILDDVATPGDPLMNLSLGYLEHSSYSPVQHDARKPKEKMLVQRIRGANAEAAIVSAAKMCEPGLDEQVAYQKELENDNIPFLILEFEEKMTAFEQMKMQIETFVESILFD